MLIDYRDYIDKISAQVMAGKRRASSKSLQILGLWLVNDDRGYRRWA